MGHEHGTSASPPVVSFWVIRLSFDLRYCIRLREASTIIQPSPASCLPGWERKRSTPRRTQPTYPTLQGCANLFRYYGYHFRAKSTGSYRFMGHD